MGESRWHPGTSSWKRANCLVEGGFVQSTLSTTNHRGLRCAALLSPPRNACTLGVLSRSGSTGEQHKCEKLLTHVHTLRAVKSPAEIAVMQKAADISSAAMVDAMQASCAGVSEHFLDATLEYGCRMRGAAWQAYPPVVAGGPRANILHYIKNDQPIKSNEMVLVDAGAEYHGYCGDISRTWPVSQGFTAAQKELYEAVLRVQLACIDACATDSEGERPSLWRLQQTSKRVMAGELKRLGLISSSSSGASASQSLRRFYPHSIGHHLGLDVHDVPTLGSAGALTDGMVITIEPGIYVPDSPDVPARFRGIGIRIEDDVVLSSAGTHVLTKACPKTVDEVEATLAEGHSLTRHC